MECGACMKNCAFNAIQVETGVGCAAALIGSYLPGNKGRVCC
jgi:ferredoxin